MHFATCAGDAIDQVVEATSDVLWYHISRVRGGTNDVATFVQDGTDCAICGVAHLVGVNPPCWLGGSRWVGWVPELGSD